MATALYRRYRPEAFAEMIGQAHVTEPLMTALRTGRIGHAYLFSGPRGCGKTTSARILARCLNCAEGPTDTPCGVCPSCVELSRDGGGSLDVVEIDAASHGGVDDARELRERAVFAPARDRFKIFIIDEAHMVTSGGFNALLKIVEEPPPHVKFVFATTEPEKVIGTIRSRTHHYPFRLIAPGTLIDYVQQLCDSEGVEIEAGVLPLVVRAGGGSVRDTLSILDQLIAGSEGSSVSLDRATGLLGFTSAELIDETVLALGSGDPAAAFAATDRVVQTGQDPRRFVEDLLERLRDLIVISATSVQGASAVFRGVPDDQLQRMFEQSQRFGPGQLSRIADTVVEALDAMVGATAPRLQLELMVARALRSEVAGPGGVVGVGVGASGSGGGVGASGAGSASGAQHVPPHSAAAAPAFPAAGAPAAASSTSSPISSATAATSAANTRGAQPAPDSRVSGSVDTPALPARDEPATHGAASTAQAASAQAASAPATSAPNARSTPAPAVDIIATMRSAREFLNSDGAGTSRPPIVPLGGHVPDSSEKSAVPGARSASAPASASGSEPASTPTPAALSGSGSEPEAAARSGAAPGAVSGSVSASGSLPVSGSAPASGSVSASDSEPALTRDTSAPGGAAIVAPETEATTSPSATAALSHSTSEQAQQPQGSNGPIAGATPPMSDSPGQPGSASTAQTGAPTAQQTAAQASFDELLDMWPALLDELLESDREAWNAVRVVQPLALEGDIFTVGLASKSDLDTFKADGSGPLREAIEAALGILVKYVPKPVQASPRESASDDAEPSPADAPSTGDRASAVLTGASLAGVGPVDRDLTGSDPSGVVQGDPKQANAEQGDAERGDTEQGATESGVTESAGSSLTSQAPSAVSLVDAVPVGGGPGGSDPSSAELADAPRAAGNEIRRHDATHRPDNRAPEPQQVYPPEPVEPPQGDYDEPEYVSSGYGAPGYEDPGYAGDRYTGVGYGDARGSGLGAAPIPAPQSATAPPSEPVTGPSSSSSSSSSSASGPGAAPAIAADAAPLSPKTGAVDPLASTGNIAPQPPAAQHTVGKRVKFEDDQQVPAEPRLTVPQPGSTLPELARYGEAVVREVLGARFIEERPLPPGFSR